jgi:lysophospholipid acyltransferase (LPLAT)-like uncharacterized protein
VLRRTWDKFAIAWPFTRVDIALGHPIEPGKSASVRGEVECALTRLNARLSVALAHEPCAV